MIEFLEILCWVIICVALIAFVEVSSGTGMFFCDLYDLTMMTFKKCGFSFAKDYQSAWETIEPKDALIGSSAEISQTFTDSSNQGIFQGQIFCQGTYWNALSKSADITNLTKGEQVVIYERKGITLWVDVVTDSVDKNKH